MSKLDAVSALAELERMEWKWESVGEDEVRTRCPSPEHKDDTPSAMLNVRKNVFKCHACGAKGDIATFIAFAMGVERNTIIVDLSTRYDIADVKTIDPSTIEKFHERINDAGPLLEALRARGVTDDIIRKRRLGFWGGRITIPVYDHRGRVVNVRRYLPGAPGDKKMQNTRGYGSPPSIYMIEQLEKYERLWICGGELKAAVAAEFLNPYDIGAIAATAGEGKWRIEWNTLLKDKAVFICNDIDDVGQAANQQVGHVIIRSEVKSVHIIDLPLDQEKHPKGDINDWVGQENATREDFLSATENARPLQVITEKTKSDLPVVDIEVARVMDRDYTRRRVRFTAHVTGTFEVPYVLPREVTVDCDRQQPNCPLCPVSVMKPAASGMIAMEIPSTSEALVGMVGASSKVMRHYTMLGLGIPTCRSVQFPSPQDTFSVYDARVSPQISLNAGPGGESLRFPVLILDEKVQSNIAYSMTGVPYPKPLDQSAVVLVDTVEKCDDDIETFQPSAEELEELRIFQPEEWTITGLDAKLTALYDDFAYNVTGIYERRAMHLMCDLAYHSALLMNRAGQTEKAWVNVLVVGDSGQGKTDVSTGLQRHYSLGERVVFKNASAAGLIGGVQQIQKRWFVTWSIFPKNDRGLVIGEEIKGMEPPDFAKLTDMRSSGVAEIQKIEGAKANARTRFIGISNPRSDRKMSAYSYGIDVLKELIGSPEDLRRFDAALLVSDQEVSSRVIMRNREARRHVPPTHTPELCRRLLLFVWSRAPEEIVFEAEAEECISQRAIAMTEAFDCQVMLVDTGTMHRKLARLSIALAARTFSTQDDDTILVRACHVEYVADFLTRIYSNATSGYLDYTKAHLASRVIKNPEFLRNHFKNLRFPRATVEGLIQLTSVSHDDIITLWGIDRETAYGQLSILVRHNCIQRHKRVYRKTDAFIDFLRELDAMDLPEESTDPLRGDII